MPIKGQFSSKMSPILKEKNLIQKQVSQFLKMPQSKF
ncbi:putative XRE-type DNA-binding protein [Bartonella japonica]|uniref:XRE-type DNA-binding protein n=1 Tax=Bartonella japonica TaxID=357761 RepID=A0ABV2FM15_9HYPH